VRRSAVESGEVMDCSELMLPGEGLRVTDPRSGGIDPGFQSHNRILTLLDTGHPGSFAAYFAEFDFKAL